MQPTATSWSCGVVVITSALHAEGPQFDPGRDQSNFNFVFEQQATIINILSSGVLLSARSTGGLVLAAAALRLLASLPAWLSGLGV